MRVARVRVVAVAVALLLLDLGQERRGGRIITQSEALRPTARCQRPNRPLGPA